MRREYYDRLVKKLEESYRILIEHNHPGIPVSLTKRELEDLHYLFKHQSPKVWSIDENGEDDVLHAKSEMEGVE